MLQGTNMTSKVFSRLSALAYIAYLIIPEFNHSFIYNRLCIL